MLLWFPFYSWRRGVTQRWSCTARQSGSGFCIHTLASGSLVLRGYPITVADRMTAAQFYWLAGQRAHPTAVSWGGCSGTALGADFSFWISNQKLQTRKLSLSIFSLLVCYSLRLRESRVSIYRLAGSIDKVWVLSLYWLWMCKYNRDLTTDFGNNLFLCSDTFFPTSRSVAFEAIVIQLFSS